MTTIYGTLLNYKNEYAALEGKMQDDPYKGPPTAPVLYIKPVNTHSADGADVVIPDGDDAVKAGASIGLIMGQDATKVDASEWREYIESLVIINDVTVPHDSVYRPAYPMRGRDGFCPISVSIPLGDIEVDQLELMTYVNDIEVARTTTADLIRSASQLLSDVTDFMTLQKGDILMLGVDAGAPLVKDGDVVRIEVPGVGELSNRFVSGAKAGGAEGIGVGGGTEANSNFGGKASAGVIADAELSSESGDYPGIFGRILMDGNVVTVTPSETEGYVKLPDDREVEAIGLHWLPPIDIETAFVLGLNYGDHAAELSFKEPPKEPLVFLKGPNTFIGHHGKTVRPDDVTFMHYECELAVVIGKSGKNIRREDAYDYVSGYTVANDYALRDYLENYYRPNLRVKNRDTCTPIGPWFVPKSEIDDPMNLNLETRLNGELVQEGSTKDMIFSIPVLIEYLSEFMTLNPGDVILTGTPKGSVDTKVGDIVATEVEGVGVLINTIVGETGDN